MRHGTDLGDRRMQLLVQRDREPITPLVYKVCIEGTWQGYEWGAYTSPGYRSELYSETMASRPSS
jgi:hypothetical protein